MNDAVKRKSPRAPSLSLDDALDKVLKIYDKDQLYEVDLDTAAQNAGYKNATSGAALSALASFGYYGLVTKRGEGRVSVSSDVREYKITPNESDKQNLLIKWLETPVIFRELLEEDFPNGLPSDANLKYKLAKKGFNDKAAEDCARVFKKSVDFSNYYLKKNTAKVEVNEAPEPASSEPSALSEHAKNSGENQSSKDDDFAGNDFDQIPVRLSGGRRAWLKIPVPFFEKDKDRLKKQIDLILTQDEEDEEL